MPLAKWHAGVAILGAIWLPLGIAAVQLGGEAGYFVIPASGSFVVLAGMILFAIIVYRTTAPA